MIENLTVTISAVVAASVVAAAMAGGGGAPQDERPDSPVPQIERPAPAPPPEPRHHEEEPQPEPRSPNGGHLDMGMNDDGTWFEMTGRDAAGTAGGAGISMTDDGFHLELNQAGADGSGSAGAAMTDDGMRLWFHVDQSQ